MGLYHCHYRLNGKLICVGVLDYLPDCLSSVYLYFDPEFAFLNLGSYSAVMEVMLARIACRPFYYMGYYIHSCQKMKYKARFRPSFIACPETFNWFPTSFSLPILDKTVYSRLDSKNAKDKNAINFTINDLKNARSQLIIQAKYIYCIIYLGWDRGSFVLRFDGDS